MRRRGCILTSLSVTGALREAGVTFEIRDGRLRVAPAAAMTPELIALVSEHKEDLAQIARTRGATGPPIESAGEVLEMARAILNPEGIVYDPPPPPPSPPGRDPMAHPNTDKAEFYRGVRERDLEKRKREGLPPWIRIIGGGAA